MVGRWWNTRDFEKKFMINDVFRGGTINNVNGIMDNFDGTVNHELMVPPTMLMVQLILKCVG